MRALRRAARAPIVYGRRLLVWKHILSSIRGVDDRSRGVLRKAALRAPVNSLKGLHRWQNPLVTEDVTVESRGIGVFKVRARTDELFCVIPDHEPGVSAVIKGHLRPGDVFIDAGANIGVYTILGSRLVGPAGKVVSIEMMPDTARRLREHIALNNLQNVTVIECALSNVTGETVAATVPDNLSGQASIVARKSGNTVSVKTEILANILAPYPDIRLMKLDVEGAEALALEGAKDVLSRIQAIVFESWGEDTDVRPMLTQAGFNIHRLDGRNLLAYRGARLKP